MISGNHDPVEKARRQWADRHPDESGFVTLVSMLRTYALLLRELERELKPLGLTLSRFEVLLLLSFTKGQRLPVMRLRDLLLVHGSSATYLVDRLVASGWVAREPDPRDRRVSMVVLTDSGREVLERGIATLVAGSFGPIGEMDEQGRQELIRLLAELRHPRAPSVSAGRVDGPGPYVGPTDDLEVVPNPIVGVVTMLRDADIRRTDR